MTSTDPIWAAKDGRSWRIGTAADVGWIVDATEPGLEITSGIPPVFEAYATLTDPESQDSNNFPTDRYSDAVVENLVAATRQQSWWLGYLQKGDYNVVFSVQYSVPIYANWHYVVVEAGPEQAATWRHQDFGEKHLPDLMFPADHSWLLSTLWDDSWTCLGGPRSLIEDIMEDERIQAWRVRLGEDATPPGHIAL